MKNKMLLLLSLGMLATVGCSSLDVSSAESVKENYPADFSYEAYMTLHPGLRSLQIQDYVSAYNKALDATVDVSADTDQFWADTASLHQIYLNPFYAGYTEELWVEDWANGEIPSDKQKVLKKFNFNDRLDDLVALNKIPVDTTAISLQYVLYGRAQGWAYRLCEDSEKTNPVQTAADSANFATKHYCADGDIVREIAE